MKIERENILSLIGLGRYHSAILTTFSFDFYFFEMKVMKLLRSAGIRNVNVLVDGYYYSELMKNNTGEEMLLTPGYSLYPIFHSGIFHPKVWMLFGEKEGLLIIGSGNLTNSGNGNNDEIWGAFHFDIRNPNNKEIFSVGWSYLSKICTNLQGLIKEKTLRWIPEQSKWLDELPLVDKNLIIENGDNTEIAILWNESNSTIWSKVSEFIGIDKITTITIVSPFYDKYGKVIEHLGKAYPQASINVVLDESGSIPEEVDIKNKIKYFDWKDSGISKTLHSKMEDGKHYSRLHAKIIHFKTNNKKEFCLFGSANATPEGVGLPGSKFNEEVSLLVSEKQGSILNKLGLELSSPKKLREFTSSNKEPIFNTILKGNRNVIQILAAEWTQTELHLFYKVKQKIFSCLKLFNTEGKELYQHEVTLTPDQFDLNFKVKVTGLQTIQFYDNEGTSVSNRILVSDYFLLSKTHPNPKTEELERICQEIEGGDLSQVIDLIHYALIDENESPESHIRYNNSAHLTKEKEEAEKIYDLDSYKQLSEFNSEKGIINSSSSLRVLDALRVLERNSNRYNGEINVDEQETDLGQLKGIEKESNRPYRILSTQLLKSEKKKLLSYFDKLYEYQQFLIYEFKPKNPPYKPTLTDLAKFNIALELLREYGGKNEKYYENGKECFFTILQKNGEEPYYNDNVKACCLNLIGDFLMLCRFGFKEYEFEYTKERVKTLKKQALFLSIETILNLRWKIEEQNYFTTLLLNTLHYLAERKDENYIKDLIKQLSDRFIFLKRPETVLKDNFLFLTNRIIPAYRATLNSIAQKQLDSSSRQGQIIYKNPFGYCYVKEVNSSNEFKLVRPGFLWNWDTNDYSRHTTDKIYSPLKIPKFFTVNIGG